MKWSSNIRSGSDTKREATWEKRKEGMRRMREKAIWDISVPLQQMPHGEKWRNPAGRQHQGS